MNKFILPQCDNVPQCIKDKVMSHVRDDINKKTSITKKWALTKVLLPNFLVLILVVGVFAYISYNKSIITPITTGSIDTALSVNTASGIIASLSDNSTTTETSQVAVINSTDSNDSVVSLDDEIAETEALLSELEALGDSI